MSDNQQVPLKSGFHAKSEPNEVLEDMDFTGKNIIVTGGYSGIGLETVRALAQRGAHIHIPVRDPKKAVDNLADVQGDIQTSAMDLGDIASIKRFAEDYSAAHDRLDLLINNAGVMACPFSHVNGWERQFGTNHMGHFALTNALMPLLKKAAETNDDVRVINLSSIGHRLHDIFWGDVHFAQTEYNKWLSYGQSKTANALFSVELNRRMGEFGGKSFSVHPGGINTPLQRHLEVEEMVAMGWMNPDGTMSEIAVKMFKSPTQGCATTLWAATSPMLKNMGGQYCEDCDVAALLAADDAGSFGVRPHAIDADNARRLWSMSEEMLANI